MSAVESNRRVSTEKGAWVQVQKLGIPEGGRLVWLRGFGNVKLFRTQLKDQLRHYVVSLPDTDTYDAFGQADFQGLHDRHWQIAQYHRMIKQVCNIEKFQVRGKVPIRDHLFAALCGYIHLQRMQFTEIIGNAYQWQKALYKDVVATFVAGFMVGKEYLNPQFRASVNAYVLKNWVISKSNMINSFQIVLNVNCSTAYGLLEGCAERPLISNPTLSGLWSNLSIVPVSRRSPLKITNKLRCQSNEQPSGVLRRAGRSAGGQKLVASAKSQIKSKADFLQSIVPIASFRVRKWNWLFISSGKNA